MAQSVISQLVGTDNAPAPDPPVPDERINAIPCASAIAIELANDYLIWSYADAQAGKQPRCGVLVSPRMYDPATALGYMQELTAQNRDRGCKISLYLSLSDAILRSFFVPAVPKNELQQVVMWEAGKVFPFQPDEEFFEWRVVDTLEWGGAKKHQIQAAAIPPARIQPVADYLTSHFELKTLTLTSLAWEPQLAKLKKRLPAIGEKSVAVIRLFGSRLTVLCYHKMALEFIRENDLDGAVTGDEFENSLSLLQDGTIHSSDFNTYRGFDCEAMARLVAEELDYYYGRFSQRSVDMILLSLPSELVEPARSALTTTLNIPVESLLIESITRGELPGASAHLLAPAAFGQPSRSKVLELLPKQYRSKIRERLQFRGALLVGAMAVTTAVLLVLLQAMHLHDASASKSSLEQTLSTLRNSEAYQGVVLMQTKSAAWQTQLAQLQGVSFANSELLRAVSELTPENAFLSSLQIQLVQNEQGQQVAAVSLNGFMSGAEEYPEVALSRYVKTLQEQPMIKRVHLQNQSYEFVNNDRRLRFTIVLEASGK